MKAWNRHINVLHTQKLQSHSEQSRLKKILTTYLIIFGQVFWCSSKLTWSTATTSLNSKRASTPTATYWSAVSYVPYQQGIEQSAQARKSQICTWRNVSSVECCMPEPSCIEMLWSDMSAGDSSSEGFAAENVFGPAGVAAWSVELLLEPPSETACNNNKQMPEPRGRDGGRSVGQCVCNCYDQKSRHWSIFLDLWE